jgi:hypothetical protein
MTGSSGLVEVELSADQRAFVVKAPQRQFDITVDDQPKP